MRSLRLAIGFLTIVPVSPAHAGPMAPARAYFPLVGLGIGGLLAGLDIAARQVLPLPVVGALLVAAMLVLTRALHTEGFLDTCDGLLGGRDRESRLDILRDSHVGAFAAIGGACLLLVKWTLLVGIPEAERLGLLFLFPCYSRFAMVAAMSVFPYARAQGLGTAFQAGAGWRQFAFALLTAAVAGGLLFGIAGLLLLVVATVVALGLGLWSLRLLGGMTGDTYGATNEVAEVTILLAGLILIQLSPGLTGAPFW
ncbi:MAG: adenosylcobinamide-GDP ribazoletransferase [Chloroflexota bacterium]|nr:adenosylcobinamide-GDP ribazoletransferase [Chloroflexota bacterium]MDE2920825.1 adenosylcobinamide-GDP ribazoletransferase [Chloroflexota bacterium]